MKEVFNIQLLDIALPQNLENMTLPSPEMVNYWRLAEERIFYIDYEIDEGVLEIQRAIIAINIADRDIEPSMRKKIRIFTYKSKDRSNRRTMGHRQPYTQVEIKKIKA